MSTNNKIKFDTEIKENEESLKTNLDEFKDEASIYIDMKTITHNSNNCDLFLPLRRINSFTISPQISSYNK